MNKKHALFILFGGQIVVGFGLLFNFQPFETVNRVFGLLLVAISPLWLIIFRLFRLAKQTEAKPEFKKECSKCHGKFNVDEEEMKFYEWICEGCEKKIMEKKKDES